MFSSKNTALIQVEKKFNDEIILNNGIVLYKDSSYNPEWEATVTGKIAALPRNHKLSKCLSVGDEIVFGYDVISERSFGSSADCFVEYTSGSNYFQKFKNGKGEALQIVAMPLVFSKLWVGVYLDKYGELVDGVQGDESSLERWKAQFSFDSNETFVFKNLIEIEQEDFWKCNLDNIFAKKNEDKLECVGDRLLLEPIVIDIKDQVEIMEGKVVPYQTLTFKPTDRAILIHDCKDLGLKKGDVVGFDNRFVEKYSIFGKEYFLIKQSRAQCKWEEI